MSLAELLELIERGIKDQSYGNQPRSLYEPIRYIMSLGGKRLRPLLVQLAYSLYKSDVEKITPYAIAVEAFHNFTLLHDDIMDKAPLRRGKKTVHEKWNINTAILSGDVMLVKVYEMFLSLPESQLKEVLKAFNQCAAEVCEGQQWDMEFETRKKVSETEYIEMIRLKTAVLLGFSLELGAILAGAPSAHREALKKFGTQIGIGFQLKDDLLDVYASKNKFGKQVGGDILANKKTFLLINALLLAKGKLKAELNSWLNAKRFNAAKKVRAVTAIYNQLSIPQMAQQKIDEYFEAAFRELDVLPPSDQKKSIIAFTKDLVNRQS